MLHATTSIRDLLEREFDRVDRELKQPKRSRLDVLLDYLTSQGITPLAICTRDESPATFEITLPDKSIATFVVLTESETIQNKDYYIAKIK